jgi:hypothetical protein
VATTLPWGESGETLFNQMFRAVATRDWLFKYGPMPFSAVMPYSFWKACFISFFIFAPLLTLSQRAAAKTDEPKLRCKLSVMVAATTVANPALDLKALSTHAVHFFPPQNRLNDYMVAANFHPLGYQASSSFAYPLPPSNMWSLRLMIIVLDHTRCWRGSMGLCTSSAIHQQIQTSIPDVQVSLRHSNI